MSSQQKISQYSFPQQNFSHQSSFHQCSLNKDLSIQFFLNRSFFFPQQKFNSRENFSPAYQSHCFHLQLLCRNKKNVSLDGLLLVEFKWFRGQYFGEFHESVGSPLGEEWLGEMFSTFFLSICSPSHHFPLFYTLDVDFTSHFSPFRTQESLLRRVSSPFYHFSFTFCNLRSTWHLHVLLILVYHGISESSDAESVATEKHRNMMCKKCDYCKKYDS